MPSRGRVGINQDERDSTTLSAIVDPGVVRSLLYQNVAGLKVDLRVIHQHIDFAIEHDRIVDAFGSVRIGVPRVTLCRRVNAHRD